MSLWIHWWSVISLPRPAISRQVTFLCFTLCCVGLSVRSDYLGVTSIVRALSLRGRYHDNLLDCCHSSAIELPALTALYGCGNLIKQALKQGDHLITRAKSNCSACFLPLKRAGKPARGRPRTSRC